MRLSTGRAPHRAGDGNSSYKSAPRLSNPVNDAGLVGEMFKNAGFDWVDIRTDLNASEMRKALRDFGGRARGAEVQGYFGFEDQ